jgi:hypothetical protein
MESVPRAPSLKIKWWRNGIDHLPPLRIEVKNVWSYTSTPRKSWQCLIRQKGNSYPQKVFLPKRGRPSSTSI